MGMQIGEATVENSMEIPQNIKNGTALQLGDSMPGYISKETQNTNSKKYTHAYAHCSVIYNSQDMETAQVPINRRADEKVVFHIYNGI